MHKSVASYGINEPFWVLRPKSAEDLPKDGSCFNPYYDPCIDERDTVVVGGGSYVNWNEYAALPETANAGTIDAQTWEAKSHIRRANLGFAASQTDLSLDEYVLGGDAMPLDQNVEIAVDARDLSGHIEATQTSGYVDVYKNGQRLLHGPRMQIDGGTFAIFARHFNCDNSFIRIRGLKVLNAAGDVVYDARERGAEMSKDFYVRMYHYGMKPPFPPLDGSGVFSVDTGSYDFCEVVWNSDKFSVVFTQDGDIEISCNDSNAWQFYGADIFMARPNESAPDSDYVIYIE
jgi:hypothetical protein